MRSLHVDAATFALSLALASVAALAGAACGCQPPAANPEVTSPTTPAAEPEAPAPTPTSVVYDLHEWGVVAVRQRSFELAAGPGMRAAAMPMAVDKPVLYVHPEGGAELDLDVRVTLGAGLSVAEHFPPTGLSPLAWHAHAGGSCRGTYPGAIDARCPGGYCEIPEIPTYETSDAACLQVGDVRAPLLFYRLFAPNAAAAPALPLRIEQRGIDVVITNEGIRTIGTLPGIWRVTRERNGTRADRVDVPAVGASVTIPYPTGEPALGHADMRRSLSALGLTREEARAFDRAWGWALFGAAAGAPEDDEDVGDVLPADDMPADRSRRVDHLSADETLPVDMPVSPDPRDDDVILYWLPSANVDAFARVEATPAPRAFRRAFLVRHVLR